MEFEQAAEAASGVPQVRVLDWYASHARQLPWRSSQRTAWGVLVSEVMLQQTPVARVEPAWCAWMDRWPTPRALADAPLAEVIRAWQGLGYPRRAIRLHASAAAIVQRHGGRVPAAVDDLRALPGVGNYTAAAVHAFAFGGEVAVLDTNVRRVLGRWLDAAAFPRSATVTKSEQRRAQGLLPTDGSAATWSVAVMELGAVVCSARRPLCQTCPIVRDCGWHAAGRPAADPPRRQPPYEGSDRQARGHILRQASTGPVPRQRVIDGWVDRRQNARAREQAERALASLAADGLIALGPETVSLP